MKRRILIVDDDAILTAMNRKVLLSSGLASEVYTASNGQKGLNHILTCMRENAVLPDVVLLDLNMPVMDGFEFIDHVKELIDPLPFEIVVFTGSSNPKDKQRVLAKGVRHFISKPYVLRELSDIMQRMDWSDMTVKAKSYP
jgi:CheY-like chemotaxis protein